MRADKGKVLRLIAFLALAAMAAACWPSCTEQELPEKLQLDVHEGWRMVTLGDSRSGSEILRRLVMNICLLNPAPGLVVHLGDMISKPGDEFQWSVFQNINKPIIDSMPFYPVAGNHDIDDETTLRIYQEQFSIPDGMTYYRVDVYNAHLIILNTCLPGQDESIAGDQMLWLHNQLSLLAGDTGFKMIFMHHPVFSKTYGDERPISNAAELHAEFLAGGVQAVFQAHVHKYAHEVHDDIHYFTSGAAGAPLADGGAGSFYHFLLVTVGADNLWVEAVSMNGDVRDAVIVPR